MNDDDLIARAREAADRAAADLDAATRGRLSAARRAALAELEAPPRRAAPGWLPIGVAAAVAAVAVGVAFTVAGPPTGGSAGGTVADAATEPGTELELFLADDEPALYDEELEFYAWLDEQSDAG